MIELDEAIEALEAAIEYKNDNINSRKLELRHSQILSQVRQIPGSQTYLIYCHWFVETIIYVISADFLQRSY